MHAKEQTLQQILEGSKQYLIPLYQRTYSWKREQIQQLWDDLAAQAALVTSGEMGPGHFLGSLVLAPTSPVAGGVQRWLVVDGQQRLTTLSLMLAALRDHVRGEDEGAADRIHRQFLINEFAEQGERFKILPTQRDRPAYEAVIVGDPGEAIGNVGDTYRMFRELLVGFDDPEDPYDLRSLESAITAQLDLVAITADVDDNVHRIFESLNNTGMQLTQGDLLRNYIFMRLPTQSATAYEAVWRPMEKLVGPENLETLAYLDLVTSGFEKANRSDTYRLQTERMSAFDADEQAVIADLKRLANRARSLAWVLEPAKSQDKSVQEALTRLSAWGAEAAWPVMLVAVDRWLSGDATADEVAQCALLLESYMVRRLLVGRSLGGVNRIMIQAANAIRDEDDMVVSLHRFLSAPRRSFPTDQQVREGVATRNFYWSGKAGQRLFVLRRLEESLGHKEQINWAEAKPQIEHVMPQTPGMEWLHDLVDSEDPAAPPEQVHLVWVHRLGNLTLTSYNQELSSDTFDLKLPRYQDSHFELTKQLAAETSWGVPEIQRRAEWLSDLVVGIWPAPVEMGAPESSDPWRVVRQLLVALPEGTWTTYGDVCAVAGTHPVALGSFLGGSTAPNAWRVLTVSGRVSDGFRWADDRAETAQEVLEAEGVRFDEHGVADPAQRLGPEELAALIGISVPDQAPVIDVVSGGVGEEQFWLQVEARRGPALAAAIRSLSEGWVGLGGSLGLGKGASPGLFFRTSADGEDGVLWPWVVYPGQQGVVEFAFQELRDRAPFVDSALREELRFRLNEVPGVQVDSAKISLKPTVPVGVLADPATVAGLLEVGEWVLGVVGGVDSSG